MNTEIIEEKITDIEETESINDYESIFDVKEPTFLLYVKKEDGGKRVFYTIKNEAVVYFDNSQISGVLNKLETKTVEYNEKDAKKYKKQNSVKLRLHLSQTRNNKKSRIIIQSGMGSWFSKSIVLRLLELETFIKTISVGAYVSDQDVLFGYVKDSEGKNIKPSKNEDETNVYEFSTEEDVIDMVDIINTKIQAELPF